MVISQHYAEMIMVI